MSEFGLGWLASLRLLFVIAFATCYWIGGRKQKWKNAKVIRRYLGAFIISIGTSGVALVAGTFNLWMLISVPAFAVALSLGYGGNTTSEKLRRRMIYGVSLAAAGLPFALAAHSINLWFFQLPVAIWTSVYLGVRNPAKSAVDEETLIATASTFVVPFYV